MTDDTKLKQQLERQAKRMQQAEHDEPTLLAQTVYVGTLGLLLVVPVVAGAYLGAWLDEKFTSRSIQWTLSLILLGVFIGALNVYLFIKER